MNRAFPYAFLAFLAACRSQDDPPEVVDSAVGDTGEETDGWLQVILDPSTQNPIAADLQVSVEREAEITASWTCGDLSGGATAQGSATLEIWGARARVDCRIVVTAQAGDARAERRLTWHVPPLPEGVERIAPQPGMPPGGMIVACPILLKEGEPSYCLGFDNGGFPIWMYPVLTEEPVHATPQPDGTMFFFSPSQALWVTPAGTIVRRVVFDFEAHHDAVPTPDGGVITMRQEARTIDLPGQGPTSLVGDVIVRLDARGNVDWEWSSFDHLDTTRFPGEISQDQALGEQGFDWTHGNALALTPDGEAVLYSARAQSWVVRIDLESGDVDWIFGKDGDFALTSGDWFYNQHSPLLLPDGTLILYDNGNERPEPPPTSRAVRYRLDEAARTAEQVWSWTAPSFTSRFGSAEPLPGGDILVGVGDPVDGQAQVAAISPDAEAGERWRIDLPWESVYRIGYMEVPGSAR